MRNRTVSFDKKFKMFRAFSAIKQQPFVASEEATDLLAWHMFAEHSEESMSFCLSQIQNKPEYRDLYSQIEQELIDADAQFDIARKAFWRRHMQ